MMLFVYGFGAPPKSRMEQAFIQQAAKNAPPPGTRCPNGKAPFPQGSFYWCSPPSGCKPGQKQFWKPDQRKWTCLTPEKSVAEKVGSGVKTVAKTVTKPIVAVSEFAFNKLTAPLRSRVTSLKRGRALKLARDRGRAVPSAQDARDAASWAKSKLKSGGPQGYLLALFAGPESEMSINGLGMAVNLGVDPATMSLIAASIPPLTLLLNSVIKKAGAAGEIASQAVQQVTQQATQAYETVAPYVPPVAAEYVQEEASEFVPMDGYFGAAPSGFRVGPFALITGLAIVTGTGAYLTYGRRRRRR